VLALLFPLYKFLVPICVGITVSIVKICGPNMCWHYCFYCLNLESQYVLALLFLMYKLLVPTCVGITDATITDTELRK
jgi:hypothetical protein